MNIRFFFLFKKSKFPITEQSGQVHFQLPCPSVARFFYLGIERQGLTQIKTCERITDLYFSKIFQRLHLDASCFTRSKGCEVFIPKLTFDHLLLLLAYDHTLNMPLEQVIEPVQSEIKSSNAEQNFYKFFSKYLLKNIYLFSYF